MHNMLSPFYKIVAEQLQKFFVSMSEKKEIGRYYLELPSEDYVEKIYEALVNLNEAQPFIYKGEKQEKEYETIALHINGMTYVIATTLNDTHVDFLVTLRNEMSEQKGQWNNSSIVMISNKKLDSIAGGSISLTSEGFPLHSSKIVSGISSEVEDSMLSVGDKRILNHYLVRQNNGQQFKKVSFLDFENLLKWLNQEKMEAEDYKFIGYFPDPHIATLAANLDLHIVGTSEYKKAQKEIDKQINKRLDDNMNLFEEVNRIREFGDEERIFKEKFDETIGKKLFRDEELLTFDDLIKAKETVNSKKSISYKAHEVKMWRKENDVEKSFKQFWKIESRLRTHDFILFVSELSTTDVVYVKLPFTTRTNISYVKMAKGATIRSSGDFLEIAIPCNECSSFLQVNYKHENTPKFNFTFRFLILPIAPQIFENHKSNYSLTSKGNLLLSLEEEKLQLGDTAETKIEVKNGEEVVEIPSSGAQLSFSPDSLEKEATKIEFKLKVDDVIIQCEVEDEVLGAPTLTNTQIWQRKMQQKVSVEYVSFDQRMLLSDKPFVTRKESRKYFDLEQQWLDENWTFALRENTNYSGTPIEMCDELKGSYYAFLQYFKDNKTIPSFTFYNEELIILAERYVNCYIECIDSIENNQHMPAHVKSILYLGSVEEEKAIFMSPFSPLNVAYQLAVVKELAGEEIERQILNKLNAGFSIPYLVGPENEIYKPVSNLHQAEWHEYRLKDNVSIGETNEYLARVVKEKLNQFTSYYAYLFDLSEEAELVINVVNIENDEEILRGIFEWFKERMKKHTTLTNIPYVKVVGYSNNEITVSAFEHFSVLTNPNMLFEKYEISCKVAQFEEIDVFQEIQKHLAFIKKPLDLKNPVFDYSHLTFYHMLTNEIISTQTVQQAPNAMNLEGLYVTPVSKRTDNGGYRIGFGAGKSNSGRTQLTNFITKVNEMSANRRNGGTDVYQKDIMLCLHMDAENDAFLEALYDACIWLVFIDPVVDLAYFQKTMDDIIIVHYSDQLSSSTGYDAITVTNKSQQYYRVIQEFLKSVGIKLTKEQIIETIMAFNTFNGEWLLRAVQGINHDREEKISVVAAIKYMLVYLKEKEPNTLWVPISMEEVVRVAGNIGISKKDGIFSHKIDSKGKLSDDLLFIGLQLNDEKTIELLFHPVEVKIGQNLNGVIEKAIQQLTRLSKLLSKQLICKGFEAKFLRNFFAKLFISNATKMQLNNFYPEEDYTISEAHLEALLNDEFVVQISDEIIGTALSFKAGENKIKHEIVSDVHIFEVPKNLAYKAVGLNIEAIANDDYSDIEEIDIVENQELEVERLPQTIGILNEQSSIENVNDEADKSSNTDEQLKVAEPTGKYNTKQNEPTTTENHYNEVAATVMTGDEYRKGDVTTSHSIEGSQSNSPVINAQKEESGSEETPIDTSVTKIVEGNVITSDIEILLGTINNGTKEIYWNHSRKINDPLSNHNIIITGDPGKGKTQSIKGIVHDIRANNIPIMLMDFKDDYIDQDFLSNENIELFDIMENGLPFNPLVPSVDKENNSFRAIGHIIQLEGIIKRIYGLGDQQAYLLRSAMLKAFERKGLNPTKSVQYNEEIEFPTFNDVFDILNEDYKKHATLIGRLDLLFQIDLFPEEPEINFEQLLESSYTLRLTKLPTDEIKSAVAEILILAMHNYFSSKEHPRKLTRAIVLDEAHRISKSEILATFARECRAFGISIIIATQFPTDMAEEIYGCTETKLFLGNDEPKHARAAAEKIVGTANKDELLKMTENIRGFKQFQAVIRNVHYINEIINILPYYKKIN